MHSKELAMALTKYKLGNLIELVLETNQENKYGSNDVRGMTITKEIIPTKADVEETDLSRFWVVAPGEFIYNPRTHGKKIGFGYNNTDDTFIISWNNIAFKIKPSMKDKALADYLFLHFKRDEWDREACFNHGEVRQKYFRGKHYVIWKLTFHLQKFSKNMLIYIRLWSKIKKAMNAVWMI